MRKPALPLRVASATEVPQWANETGLCLPPGQPFHPFNHSSRPKFSESCVELSGKVDDRVRVQEPDTDWSQEMFSLGPCQLHKLKVSVIVPTIDEGEIFRRCIESLQSADPPPDEIIVVVDGEAGGQLKQTLGAGVVVLYTGARGGPARARNLGARAAHGDLLLFVDADVTIGQSVIGDVASTFTLHPEFAALVGSYDNDPGEPNFFSQYKNLIHHFVHQRAREEGHTFWGACGAIRRHNFFEIGGFDEDYRVPSIEDIELGIRLKAAGHRIALCKSIQVKHLKRWAPYSLFHSDFFCRAIPWTKLILRSGRLEDDLNTDRESRAKVILVYVLLAMLIISWQWPLVGGPLAAATAVLLLALDVPLLRFFFARRGFVFALQTIPWTLFYYFYCGVGFTVGLMAHLSRNWRAFMLEPSAALVATPLKPRPPHNG